MLIGTVIAVIGFVWELIRIFGYHQFNDKYETIASTLAAIGLLIVMFSKEKIDDEFVNQLRLRSFLISTLIVCTVVISYNVLNVTLNINISFSSTVVLALLQAIYLICFWQLKEKFNILNK